MRDLFFFVAGFVACGVSLMVFSWLCSDMIDRFESNLDSGMPGPEAAVKAVKNSQPKK